MLLGQAHPDAAALRVELARRLVAHKLGHRKAAGSRGPTPAGYAVILVGGPPCYRAPDAWPVQRVLAFGEATVDFVRTRFPYSFIAQAHVHQDATAPYIRLWIVPVGSTGTIGWNAVRRDLPGANHRAALRALHDDFHEDVARKFGLDRGGRYRRSSGEE